MPERALMLKSRLSAFLLLLDTPQPRAADEYVVIAVDPPAQDLPLCRLFVVNDVINVPAGTSGLLLDEDGVTHSLIGPATSVVVKDVQPSQKTTSPLSTIRLIAALL